MSQNSNLRIARSGLLLRANVLQGGIMPEVLQRRMSKFVDWVRPDPAENPAVRKHANDVLDRVKAKAIEKDIPVVDGLIGGSFAKKTGLRRHMRGYNEIEGQDIDLVFVVNHKDDEKYFSALVSKFLDVVKASYPNTEATPTKCSVQVEFVNPLVTYDVVPTYKTDKPDFQLIVRTDLERRLTSVDRHTQFIATRIKKSQSVPGRVEFNEGIRLVKWWRCIFLEESFYLKNDGIPSTLLELLFSKVFDEVGVQKTYAETLVQWFSKAAGIVENKTLIYFNDFTNLKPMLTQINATWNVLDPVNFDNNITKRWSPNQIQELADGLKKAKDNLQRAISRDMFDDPIGSLDALEKVFGTSVKNHCGDDE